MKWFKHMSDASDDAFIEDLEDRFGLKGYARWWKLVEVIAKKMDQTDDCFAEHSWVKWQSFLKGKKNKLITFLTHCENEGRIKLEQNGNILKISCPKLLKLRDNHSKNLQVTNKTTAKQLARVDIDKDIEDIPNGISNIKAKKSEKNKFTNNSSESESLSESDEPIPQKNARETSDTAKAERSCVSMRSGAEQEKSDFDEPSAGEATSQLERSDKETFENLFDQFWQ